MSRFGLSVAGPLVLVVLFGLVSQGVSAPLDELIAAAKKDGVVEFYGPSPLGPQGSQALGQAFNKKYGLNITVNYHPSANMTQEVGKVVGLSASGVPPEWDVMVVTDAQHAALWLRKLHASYEYRKVGIDPKAIYYDNGAISFVHQIVLPAYNKKTLPAKDVPKKWEDLLDPKWTGKIGVTHVTQNWARLAAGPWGEEKATQFVRKLAELKPFLGRPAELTTRLQLGEVLLLAGLHDQFIFDAEKKGAPLAHAHVEPVIAPALHVGVLKGARHPSSGHLFTAFMMAPEAQEIWEKYNGHSSAFVPSTRVYKYVQGKQTVYLTQDQAAIVDRLADEYGRILGFTK